MAVSKPKKETCICPKCNVEHTISERDVSIYDALMRDLWRVYQWCKKKDINTFQLKEVRHMIGQLEYGRFNNLVDFGGLVEKVEGRYVLNMELCELFYKDKLSIPTVVWKNPTTGVIKPDKFATISKLPKLFSLLNEDQEYVVHYRENPSVKVVLPKDNAITKVNETEWLVWHKGNEFTVKKTINNLFECGCPDYRFHKKCTGIDKVRSLIKHEEEAIRQSQQRSMF